MRNWQSRTPVQQQSWLRPQLPNLKNKSLTFKLKTSLYDLVSSIILYLFGIIFDFFEDKADVRQDNLPSLARYIPSASTSSSSSSSSSPSPSSSAGRSATAILLSAIASSHSSSPSPSTLTTPPRPTSPLSSTSPLITPSFSSSSSILSSFPARPSSQSWTPQYSSSNTQNYPTTPKADESYLHNSTLIPPPNPKDQIYPPIPSTPTIVSNPLLDSKLANSSFTPSPSSRSPPNSPGSFSYHNHHSHSRSHSPSNPPSTLPPPPPPITPRTILTLQHESAPPPPSLSHPPPSAHLAPTAPSPPPALTVPPSSLSSRDTNWAEYLQTLLPGQSEV